MSRRKNAMVAALAIVLAASTGCSIVQQGWYYYATERGRVDRHQYRANQAQEAGEFARAEKKIAKARKLRPASALLASGQALIIAEAGRAEEALAILEEADRLGYDSVYGVDDPRWDPVRDTARFAALKSSLKARGEEKRRAWFDVEVPDPSMAPSFDKLVAVEIAFDREREERENQDDWPLTGWTYQVEDRLRTARRIAALERFAAEHPKDGDAERALDRALRARADVASWSGLAWNRRNAAEVEAAAERFVGAYPESKQRASAEFLGLVAAVAGVVDAPPDIPEDGAWPPDPPLACAGTMDRLKAAAGQSDGGPWAVRAGALLAICLDQDGAADAEIAAAYGPYFADRPDRALRLDFDLFGSAFKVKLRREGPPPFEATTLDGVPVDLASLKGRVAFLNFWAPT